MLTLKAVLSLLLVISLSLPCPSAFAEEPTPPATVGQAGGTAEFKAGEILVKFREGAPRVGIQPALSAQDVRVLGEIHGLGILRLSVPVGHELEKIRELQRHPLVEYAEPNYIAHVKDTMSAEVALTVRAMDTIPNDPLYPSQWNLAKIGAPSAWDITTGSQSVVIAIIDSGVDLDHPELEAKIWTKPCEVPGNGLDDDGNGYKDDVHGWDFVNWDNDPQDDYGHGTFVAGIAAAETDNGIGIAGVSWGAKVMPVKVIDANGYAYYSDITSAIYYAADNGAKIINMSFDSAAYSQALQAAVAYAHSKGCLLVAAAGDTGDDTYRYPASHTHVVSVAATNRDDEHWGSSTHNDRVDVTAPGVEIRSFWEGGYGWISSTRMAAPHVSGLAALIWSVNPTLTPDEVKGIVESTAVDLGDPGRDDYFGHGRIDANAAVKATPHYLQVSPTSLVFLADDNTGPLQQAVTNPGTSPSTWSATAGATPWLSITGPFGHTPSSITVSADKGTLPGYGLYTTPITVTSTMPNSENNPQIITATFSYVPQLYKAYIPLFFMVSAH